MVQTANDMRRVGLITDFGTRDPYVGAMKGVIASRTEAPIVDCTHEIAPFDVWEAAFYIRAMARYWPDGTIFTVVIDPGVGTARRIVAVDSAGQIFLAPDNGVLTFVIGIAHSVENESLFLPGGSTTFHGRDRFAPVAAALANGLSIEQLGPRADNLVRLDYQQPAYDRRHVEGTIVAIDRFGNLITDIERSRIPFAEFAMQSPHVTRVATTYSGDGLFLIIGSTSCVEISIAGASAAAALKLKRGDRVTVVPA
jgi:S-adenosylmethionine hydrolase